MQLDRILEMLSGAGGDYLSGEEIAGRLGVSRAAVWKMIGALRENGYRVESRTKRGYRLVLQTDVLQKEAIQGSLQTEYLGRRLEVLRSVDSTNRRLRALAEEGAPHGTVLLADEQTAGRGRGSRSFASPADNGLYLSMLLYPKLGADKIHLLTVLAAVSVQEAIGRVAGVVSDIKWVNDLYLDGRKLGGILTEAVVSDAEAGGVGFAVIGVGLNIGSARLLPQEVAGNACAVGEYSGQTQIRCRLAAEILNRFEKNYEAFCARQDPAEILARYRKRLLWLGDTVQVLPLSGAPFAAKALDVDRDGRLLVQMPDGEIRRLAGGEIQVRRPEPER